MMIQKHTSHGRCGHTVPAVAVYMYGSRYIVHYSIKSLQSWSNLLYTYIYNRSQQFFKLFDKLYLYPWGGDGQKKQQNNM